MFVGFKCAEEAVNLREIPKLDTSLPNSLESIPHLPQFEWAAAVTMGNLVDRWRIPYTQKQLLLYFESAVKWRMINDEITTGIDRGAN
jgi:hypothetical protein